MGNALYFGENPPVFLRKMIIKDEFQERLPE
jgi:hypothetical protein